MPPPELDRAAGAGAKPLRRAPVASAKLLLPVWGHRYVRQFLEVGLPTLLAPGNVPALAQSLPCEFELLTSAADESYVRQHRAFDRLADVCRATIRPIDHLITLEHVPAGAAISLARVTFGVCLSCIFDQNCLKGCVTNERGAFFRHDDSGLPVAID